MIDYIELRQELSELTEEALIDQNIEAIKKIKQIVDNPGIDAPNNFGEFFYSMLPDQVLISIR